MTNLLNFIDPDKILKNSYVLKLRILYVFSLISIGVWAYTEQVSVLWFIAVFYLVLLFGRVGSEAGFHRYFSHKSYETTKFKERLLLWWGTVAGVGSCLSWATMHRLHHKDADTENDPHSPYFGGWVKPFFGIPSSKNYDHKITRDLLKDKTQIFTHKHYFKINFAWIGVLSLISYALGTMLPLIIFFSMASISLWLLYGITNTIEHRFGYRTYEVHDQSKNQPILRLLFLGAGLHNNHHWDSKAANFNIRKNWWEFDFDYFLIRTFFKKNPAQV